MNHLRALRTVGVRLAVRSQFPRVALAATRGAPRNESLRRNVPNRGCGSSVSF